MEENTLPDNIYELKRPALVALCKQRGIKAVGKVSSYAAPVCDWLSLHSDLGCSVTLTEC